MDRQVDRRTDGLTQTDGQTGLTETDELTEADGQTDGHAERQTDRQTGKLN